jgi:hypothetical protein
VTIPFAGGGRRAAPGEGDSPTGSGAWKVPLTPPSPRKRGEGALPPSSLTSLQTTRFYGIASAEAGADEHPQNGVLFPENWFPLDRKRL